MSEVLARVEAHLNGLGLPTRIADIQGDGRPDVDTLMKLMAQDKKVRAGQMTFILVRGVGGAFVTRDVDPGALQEFLSTEIAACPSKSV